MHYTCPPKFILDRLCVSGIIGMIVQLGGDIKPLGLSPSPSCYSQGCQTVATWQSFISFWQLCDIFITTFWWFPFKLANQNVRTGGGGIVKCHVGFPTVDSCASQLARCNKKPSESCRKDVEKLSKKLIQNFVRWPWLDALDFNSYSWFSRDVIKF